MNASCVVFPCMPSSSSSMNDDDAMIDDESVTLFSHTSSSHQEGCK